VVSLDEMGLSEMDVTDQDAGAGRVWCGVILGSTKIAAGWLWFCFCVRVVKFGRTRLRHLIPKKWESGET
jgi:hypothetical protein